MTLAREETFAWMEAPRQFLAGDASSRTYYRLEGGGQTRVLMDTPDECPSLFVKIADYLGELGLSAPTVFEAYPDALVLEDLGDRGFRRALREGVSEDLLYENAVRALIHLHKNATNTLDLPPYDGDAFLREIQVFVDWYMSPHGFSASQKEAFMDLWRKAFHQGPKLPATCVLRDYMVDNLIHLEDREGVRSCGILDFQDALWGPPTYDLVSLLEDARRDVCPLVAARMRMLYLEAFPDLKKADFYHSYALWGAGRNIKIIGVFSRLALRDHKVRYVEFIPRVWGLLEHELQHPALKEIKNWMDTHMKVRRCPLL